METAAVSALQNAFADVGLVGSQSDPGIHLSVRLPDHSRLEVQVETASLPSTDWVRGLHIAGDLMIVVADQIPNGVRHELNERGIGWLDRRGHLRIVRGGVFVDADVPPAPRSTRTGARRPAISGRSGLAAAAALLMRPDDPKGVSEIARQASLNASSVSRAMTALADAQLAERTGRGRYRPLVPELFWALADVWPNDRASLDLRATDLGDPRLRAGLEDLDERGWATGGERGAVAWGAPLVLTGDHPTLLYVPDEESIRVARALAGSTGQSSRAGTSNRSTIEIRVDPTGLATVDRHPAKRGRVPLAHPLFCALDLTAASRDREALEQWDPPEGFTRVW